MVSIAAFQAVDPGSIPGRRSFFISFFQWAIMIFLQVFFLCYRDTVWNAEIFKVSFLLQLSSL